MSPILKQLALLAAVSSQVCAANPEDKIATDRPDFVESSDVVGRGHVQIETGYTRERSHSAGQHVTLSNTPTLLRLGVSDTLELRVESEGYMHSSIRAFPDQPEDNQQGYSDLSLGLKWHFSDAAGTRPSMALLTHLDLDTGSRPFRAKGKGGSLRLAAEWEFDNDIGLGLMPGLNWQYDDDGRRYTGALLGVVVSKEWSEQFRTFIEYSAPQISRARHGGVQHTFDIGAAYLLTDNMQIDTVLSRGLNQRTPDWSWSLGFSIKF